MRATIVRTLLSLLAVCGLASGAQAVTILGDAVPLSELVDDPEGEILVGDKLFTDFSYDATGDMPTVLGVNVIPILDDDGHFGIRFQGGFGDLPSSPGASDALISFTVTATLESFFIVDAHLAGNPELIGELGSISVVETFDFDPELRLTIFDDEEAGQQSVDWVDFEPIKSIEVTKDIFALAAMSTDEQTGGAVTLSFIDQTFSQVPEPGTAALLVVGLTGLGWLGRRRA